MYNTAHLALIEKPAFGHGLTRVLINELTKAKSIWEMLIDIHPFSGRRSYLLYM